jgi:hypothetical protein
MLARRLLLPHAIVTEKRSARLTLDVRLTHERDVFAASYGEEHADAELGVHPACARDNTIRDRLPVALVSTMNQPRYCRCSAGSIELGAKPFHDAAAVEWHGRGNAGNGDPRRTRIETGKDIVKLGAQIRKCSPAPGIGRACHE